MTTSEKRPPVAQAVASALTPAGQVAVASSPRNLVLPLLIIAAAIGAVGCGFVDLAPNRLVSGRPVMLGDAAGAGFIAALAACGAILLAIGLAPQRRLLTYLAAAFAGAALVIVLAAAGHAAAILGEGAPPAARVSLGAGFWIVLSGVALAFVDALQRAGVGAAVQLLVAALAAAVFVVLAETGLFDALSLAREFATRREIFVSAAVRHIVLVAAAVGPAVLLGVPLGLAALRQKRFEQPLFAVLNLLQTIPSIALFGLLLIPLSALAKAVPGLAALGIGGIGPAPAIIALVLYALLPVARNTLAGIGGVSPVAIDAARGMGMTRGQLFRQVELPLALPVLIAGLRIVTVQAIGLAVVAALIGAGGLGSFVFDGLGQYATDLVLLGALPAIVLALAADLLLRLAADRLGRRYAP
jgi:osmoprotectant transport system permease protein